VKSFGGVHAALISHSNPGGTRLWSLMALSGIAEIPRLQRGEGLSCRLTPASRFILR
jgi:hypothetical protein